MEHQMPKSKEAPKDAIALLKEDHQKVEDLFARFEKAREGQVKERLVKEICQELVVHTMIEEEIFYPACREAIDDDDMMDEAQVEHDGAKMLIIDIQAGSASDQFYDAKVSVLSEQIKHHVHEEEMRSEGMFSKARDAGLDVEALGEQMIARKEALKAQTEADGPPVLHIKSMGSAKSKPLLSRLWA
jgi:hypothetical protein